MPDISSVIDSIARGAPVNSEDVLHFICQESKKDRIEANFKLAEAYCNANDFEQARVFIRRAWELSEFAEECLPLFIRIHSTLSDVASIREAHKRLGIRKASHNDIGGALACFNAWQYADALHKGIDSYQYDYDVLDCIATLARPHSFPAIHPAPLTNRKVRLAYLMFGVGQINSVIVKHSLSFAQFHDKERFEIKFFVPEREAIVSKSEEAKSHIKAIEAFQCNISIAPNSALEEQSLIKLAASIHDFSPDILVTSAALADLRHYFIASLRPAPLIIGLCQGPPPQYISPSFDWSISWTKHPLIDCPSDCSLVAGGTILPQRQYSTEDAKRSMGIPAQDLVLMSCGRDAKFQDPDFWQAIVQVVQKNPHVRFVAVGISRLPDFLNLLIPPDLKQRIKLLGWQKDFLNVLSMADVMVDTYPSGGGVTILDAMAFGIPVVSFKNNYMQKFAQTDWSPAEEFMGVPELLVERGNFEKLKLLVTKLLTDHRYRINLSRRCVESVHSTSGHPEIMVRSCEQVYVNVLKKKLDRGLARVDTRAILPPLPRPKSLLSRISGRLGREWKSFWGGLKY